MSKQERNRLKQMVRDTARDNRARSAARRRLATRTPQSAKTWLLDAGIPLPVADRYASAFSRSLPAMTTDVVEIKKKSNSRKTMTVPRKLYDFATVVGRIMTYRPKNNPEAAAAFTRAAALTAR